MLGEYAMLLFFFPIALLFSGIKCYFLKPIYQSRSFDSAWTMATIEGATEKIFPSANSCQRKEADPWPLLTFDLLKRPTLYIVATSSKLASAMEYLDGTVTRCPDKVSPGAFQPVNSIVFLLPGNSSSHRSNTIVGHDIFSNQNIQMHGQVAALMATTRPNLLVSLRHNIYTNRAVKSVINFEDSEKNSTSVLFSPFDMEVG